MQTFYFLRRDSWDRPAYFKFIEILNRKGLKRLKCVTSDYFAVVDHMINTFSIP